MRSEKDIKMIFGKDAEKKIRVAEEILKYNKKGEPIWFTKLVELLSSEMSKPEICRAIDYLYFDLMIVEIYSGQTKPGHAGFLYYLREGDRPPIEEISEQSQTAGLKKKKSFHQRIDELISKTIHEVKKLLEERERCVRDDT